VGERIAMQVGQVKRSLNNIAVGDSGVHRVLQKRRWAYFGGNVKLTRGKPNL
jgi:hypothetical protein